MGSAASRRPARRPPGRGRPRARRAGGGSASRARRDSSSSRWNSGMRFSRSRLPSSCRTNGIFRPMATIVAFRSLGRPDHADLHLGVAQVRRRLDVGDRGEPDLRVVDLPRQDRPSSPGAAARRSGRSVASCRSEPSREARSSRRRRAEKRSERTWVRERASQAQRAHGRSGPRPVRRRPGYRLLGEAFDDVAFLEVVEPGEADAALVVLLDLADVVAEPAERLDPVGRR